MYRAMQRTLPTLRAKVDRVGRASAAVKGSTYVPSYLETMVRSHAHHSLISHGQYRASRLSAATSKSEQLEAQIAMSSRTLG
jgi:hypothetical protein